VAHNKRSTIHIRRGLNLPLTGRPDQEITVGNGVSSVALQGTDFIGLKPRLLIEQGQQVLVGQPLFVDKRDPEVSYTAPASGTVTLINRGARRILQSVVIELDGSQAECDDYRSLAGTDPASLSPADVATPLYKSGLWSAFRTRPYNKVPQSGTRPAAIFITAIDTQPLAADPALVVREHALAFTCGVRVIAQLTDGCVHMCTAPDWQGPAVEGAQHTEFAGPHPAGLAGTHINYLHPVGTDRTVWHIAYQDVIAIGKLFVEGQLWTERIVALGGQGFARPRLVSTQLGASIDDLTAGELVENLSVRLISGSVLNGHTATGPAAWLGRYHTQVTALPERGKRKLFGWLRSGGYSFAGRLSSHTPAPAGQSLTTGQYGRLTAMLPIDAFDKVMPLDMLPGPLLKALLIKDTDQAQQLGCLELAPEDLALCTFVCPGKNDYGAVLLENLEQIERDG
jgi:Na+-transporting NADH:ubiquinone oxidoreductase subunit A